MSAPDPAPAAPPPLRPRPRQVSRALALLGLAWCLAGLEGVVWETDPGREALTGHLLFSLVYGVFLVWIGRRLLNAVRGTEYFVLGLGGAVLGLAALSLVFPGESPSGAPLAVLVLVLEGGAYLGAFAWLRQPEVQAWLR